jgi:hypothetical protein
MLTDDGQPWPRKYAFMTDMTKELREDPAVCQGYLDHMPDDMLSSRGLKRAPGCEWDLTWVEVTEMEVEMHKSINAQPPPDGIGEAFAPFEAGDWHIRGVAWVVIDPDSSVLGFPES